MNSEVIFQKKDTFPDLATFTKKLGDYQNKVKQFYVKSSSRTLSAHPVEDANPACVYVYVKYVCKYSENRHNNNVKVYHEGSRETK